MKQNNHQSILSMEYWLGVGLVVVVLAGLQLAGLEDGVRGVIESGARPLMVQSSKLYQIVRYPIVIVSSWHNTARRIQNLEQNYSSAIAQLERLKSVEQENQELRRLLENTDRTISSTQITKPILSYNLPLVSAGESSGVREGSLILSAGVLLGTVDEVSPEQSVVMLLSQPSHPPIVVKTESGANGLLVGDGSRLKITEVAVEQNLQVGEIVSTVGQPGVPAALVVGTVVKITSPESSPTKEAIVEQPVDFFSSLVVEVL